MFIIPNNQGIFKQYCTACGVPQAYINKIASYVTQTSTILYNDQKRDQRTLDAVQRHWSGMIPKSYLYDIHQKIISGIQVGSVAGDSTGYSNNGSVLVRHDMSMTKRWWIKLHHTIDIPIKAILEYGITDGYAADITSMWPMTDRLGGPDVKDNFFCLDSADLAGRCGA